MIQIALSGDDERRLRQWMLDRGMETGGRHTAKSRVEHALLVLEAIENCSDERLRRWAERGSVPSADCETCGGDIYDDDPMCEVCGPPFGRTADSVHLSLAACSECGSEAGWRADVYCCKNCGEPRL